MKLNNPNLELGGRGTIASFGVTAEDLTRDNGLLIDQPYAYRDVDLMDQLTFLGLPELTDSDVRQASALIARFDDNNFEEPQEVYVILRPVDSNPEETVALNLDLVVVRIC